MNDVSHGQKASGPLPELRPEWSVRKDVDALARVLTGLLDSLALATSLGGAGSSEPKYGTKAAASRDLSWLRPLAVATTELEYAVRHGPHVDWELLIDACDEVRRLLDEPSLREREFAARYARQHAGSIDLAQMHAQALAGCCRLASLAEGQLHETKVESARVALAEAGGREAPAEDDETRQRAEEERVDETLAESFPASDPPSWTLGVLPLSSK